jgi:hypothetical protein
LDHIDVEEFHANSAGGGDLGGVLVHHGLGGDCGIPKPGSAQRAATAPASVPAGAAGDVHRIGGGSVENLRLKPREAALDVPGISVIKASTPGAAAQEMRTGLPKAKGLHGQAKTIGTTSEEAIRRVGFDIIPTPSTALPNHHRIVHPEGVAGFNDANLAELAEVFVNTTGY